MLQEFDIDLDLTEYLVSRKVQLTVHTQSQLNTFENKKYCWRSQIF